MGKLFHLMGKSACGKDTLYGRLLGCSGLELHRIIPYTTRPQRSSETEGVEYHFTGKDTLDALCREGRVIEQRCYHTVHGDWYYFTVDDGQINLENKDYLMIGTLETYAAMSRYFGPDRVVPLYITLETGERLTRALSREKAQSEPRYKELCRRFLADEEDFSEEKLRANGIDRGFENTKLGDCLQELTQYILDCKAMPQDRAVVKKNGSISD